MARASNYTALKQSCAFRMKVRAVGFTSRALVDAGEDLYDVLLGWLEEDGSILYSDIGGQKEIGWNPHEGHGSIGRLLPDDRRVPLVPPGNMGQGMPLQLLKAPANFGRWKDHIFFTGQTCPGRPGATKPHAVYKLAPGADRPELFAVLPNAGRVGGGLAGSVMPGTFGRSGTTFDGSLLVQSFMNCTIYRVTPDARAEPFVTLEGTDGTIMPVMVQIAPPWWSRHAGEIIVFGARNTHFEGKLPGEKSWGHWRLNADATVTLIPEAEVPCPINAVVAPPEFGPFGGCLFWADEGPVNLAQVEGCDQYAEGLPYLGRILCKKPGGPVQVFADDFQGSYTTLVFDRNRLIMGLTRRSYCTGEFHEPDASIYEIKFAR